MPEAEPKKVRTSVPDWRADWRRWLYVVIFESDTRLGRAFDVLLIVAILLSVGAVMLESVASIRVLYLNELRAAEWVFTILFTVEYVLRLVTAPRPLRYAKSFFGVVDLLAVIPTYLSLVIPGTQYFLVVRMLRVLRVFRVLKLAEYLSEASVLILALRASRRKIELFIFTVITLVVILGSLMYFVEGPENGFSSIPRSVYWAIVTLTTVGYGDISPQTDLGQALSAVVMILGYGIIAVPTGIVTAELTRAGQETAARAAAAQTVAPAAALAAAALPRACPACGHAPHDADAAFCKRCGASL